MAPDLKSGMDAAERRCHMIQESKFLGGLKAYVMFRDRTIELASTFGSRKYVKMKLQLSKIAIL